MEICINSNNDIHAKSFQLGAVRLLNFSETQKSEALQELSTWLRQFRSIDHVYGLGGNLRALMQANEIKGLIKTSDFNDYVSNYMSIDNTVLIEKHDIPKDLIDIIPVALNLYSLIMEELNSKVIENTFWSISDGLVKKVIKDQL